MAVIAFKAEIFLLERIGGDFFRRAVRDRKTELAVRLCRLDKAVRVRLYPGVDAEQDLLFPAIFRAERVQPVKLRIRIHDDQPTPALCGKFEFALQFVVPVQAHFCRGKTRFQRSIKLPA